MITPSQRQILEAVLEALPSDVTPKRKNDMSESMSAIGYNWAIKDVRAIINEFLSEVENE